MSVAEKIFHKAQLLPEAAQTAVLEIIEQLAVRYPPGKPSAPLTLRESAEMRGRLAAWEEDWNAPGMEVYDRP
ncbi:MAG TPA: hypothetical protein VG077_11965 [Verrucomicrobiae bacterium]|nr:hypothetical protein [Verrucomicrobiae bacterium]